MTRIALDSVGGDAEGSGGSGVLAKNDAGRGGILTIALAERGAIALSAVVMDADAMVRGEVAAEEDAAGMDVADSVAVDVCAAVDPDAPCDPGVGLMFAVLTVGVGLVVFDDVVTDNVAGVGARIRLVGPNGNGTTVGGTAVADDVFFDDDGGDAGFDFDAFGAGAGDMVAFDQDAVDRGGVLAIADVDAFSVVLFFRIVDAVAAGVADGVVQDLDVLAAGFNGDRFLSNILDAVIANDDVLALLYINAPEVIAEVVVFDDDVATILELDSACLDAADGAVLLGGAVGVVLGGVALANAALV